METRKILIIILIIILGFFYYNLTSEIAQENISRQSVVVSEVVDGDTLKFEFAGDKYSARLKGLNCPEKGMFLFNETGNFLAQKVEGREVMIESFGTDRYGRFLVYVFVNENGREINVNKLMIEKGLAHLYYYGEDKYYDDMENAEKFAREKGLGIWKKDENFGCLILQEFDYLSEGGEKIVLENVCDEEIGFVLKDDATHIYEDVVAENSVWKKEFEKIWNDDGDSIYIWGLSGEGNGFGREAEQGLLMFERY